MLIEGMDTIAQGNAKCSQLEKDAETVELVSALSQMSCVSKQISIFLPFYPFASSAVILLPSLTEFR